MSQGGGVYLTELNDCQGDIRLFVKQSLLRNYQVPGILT